MTNKFFAVLVGYGLLSTIYAPLLTAQEQTYPQNYFRNPLNIPIYLAGNFGECRPNHFHSGIDIKTKGKEDEPVYAAADGYVSRIKMESGGFGHGLYITHPNGYTTLYAHLNDFAPALQQYVHGKQYDSKKWNVDLYCTPSQFPVKKGQLIAYSGNTGGSTAPHLHFEIRNTKTEHPLNPMLFGLPITDDKPPIPLKIAFYQHNIYESEPTLVSLKKSGNVYRPVKYVKGKAISYDTITIPEGVTSVGIQVDDYMNESDNQLTFYTAALYFNDSLQVKVTLDDVGYDESRYINAYVDYKWRKQHGNWLQCLFQLPGNKLGRLFTFPNAKRGSIDVMGTSTQSMKVVLTDCNGNESIIQLYLKPVPNSEQVNTGALTGIPFYANRPNRFSDVNLTFQLDEQQLYNDFSFQFNKKREEGMISEKYQLHYAYVPIHHYFDLLIKPIIPIQFELRKKVVLMYGDGKNNASGIAAEPSDNGFYVTRVRNFGSYWLAIDTVPPIIKPIQKPNANLKNARKIQFVVKDEATSIKNFSGYIDGEWVCIEQHGSLFFYTFDEHCSSGKHQLLFKTADENGNQSEYQFNFIR